MDRHQVALCRAGRAWAGMVPVAMVPLMVPTLAAVVAAQISRVSARLPDLLVVVTQTLVERVAMVVLVRLVPRLPLAPPTPRMAR